MSESRKSTPKLTRKQTLFVKGIAEGKNQTQAALAAYDTTDPDVAKVIASENITKPNVKEAIDLAMVKLNLTPERVLKPIDDALNDDDVKTRLMGTDRALKLMNIGNKDGGNTINNFGQMIVGKADKYGE
jgi:phage terminase small subunit